MLLSTTHRRVLLDPSADVQNARQIIPNTQDFTFEGRTYVMFPHGIAETRVLRNIGYNVPAPILSYYKWPGQYKPMAHQLVTSAFLTLNPKAFVLNDIGTSKTLATLWAADYLMELGVVRRVLVVGPLSTLVPVWGDHIFKHLCHRSHTILHGGSRQQRLRLFAAPFDFYIINREGATGMAAEIAAREDIDLVIIDELADYRNGQTQRWKEMKKTLRASHWVWGLTGRPIPNAPTDAFSQAKLVNPFGPVARYRSYTEFQNTVMEKHGPFTLVPRPDAIERAFEIMQPAIRYSRDECLDLPPCTVQTLDVELTPEQKKAYKDLVNEFATEINGASVTAFNEAVKSMRLVQVVSGTLYDVDGVKHVVPSGPRLALVKEIVESASKKVIIFCPFTGNLQPIVDSLKGVAQCELVYGATPKNTRDDIFHRFQHDAEPRVLVAHPQCMAHGLTLTSAATIIWWAPFNSHDIYDQANGRINRNGQDHPSTIIHISGTAVERRMYKRLEDKGTMQGIFLEMVEEAKKL